LEMAFGIWDAVSRLSLHIFSVSVFWVGIWMFLGCGLTGHTGLCGREGGGRVSSRGEGMG